ncbi:MAG TPA: glycosyltransferase family 4 protein [Tepidiformaceae bacterium]|nr:glycosyltransferase family 4 protein [Tepidiformaceae bacterium]
MNAPTTFCLEQTLGHRTHSQNLEAAIARRDLSARVIRVEQRTPPDRLPWALRGSRDAWRSVPDRSASGPVFFHTQTISLFAPLAAHHRPYVVSVDATPEQVDAMGSWYRHRRGPGLLEGVKKSWYRKVLEQASAVVAWSEWAAGSLTQGYGVSREKILVAHPGAPVEVFDLQPRHRCDGVTRILFVGGDFERKGGPHLLEAFHEIRRPGLELVLVTETDVSPAPGIRVEHGVRPRSDRLLAELGRADIFCLPTLGDCTPVAVEEAMAAGLPVVATTVGSISETVVEGECGLLVPPGDPAALAAALERLVEDADARRRMGEAARARARHLLDADTNASRIIDLMLELA